MLDYLVIRGLWLIWGRKILTTLVMNHRAIEVSCPEIPYWTLNCSSGSNRIFLCPLDVLNVCLHVCVCSVVRVWCGVCLYVCVCMCVCVSVCVWGPFLVVALALTVAISIKKVELKQKHLASYLLDAPEYCVLLTEAPLNPEANRKITLWLCLQKKQYLVDSLSMDFLIYHNLFGNIGWVHISYF